MLVILDGASDLPVKVFGGKTPLEIAETPNLDWFTKNGKLGYMYPINENITPGSDDSLISLFGNNPRQCRRGIYEAIGLGIKLKRGDLAFRTNFGTIDNLKSKKVIDRRAGRTLTTKEARELAKTINKKIKLSCRFEFYPAIQHRGVLVFRGGFSDNITNTDSEWNSEKDNKFRFSEPLDEEEESRHASNTLNYFFDQVFRILDSHPVNKERRKKGLFPVNMLFTRGGGSELPKLKQYRTWMSINTMPLEIGISQLSGMKTFSFKYPELKKMDVYQNLHAGLNQTIRFVIKTIKKRHKDFLGCYLQFKETDIPGHDNKPYEKRNMIEDIDRSFFGFLKRFAEKNKIRLVVTCDHSTPCNKKMHSADPVPVLVYGGEKDETEKFCEKNAKKGSLGKIYGRDFMIKTGLNN